MKKLILAAALLSSSFAMAAGDSWTMTGVMAVYPGTVNAPFSAPILNPTVYATKAECDKAILAVAKAHPAITMINNGNMLPTEKTQGGYVAVAASCN